MGNIEQEGRIVHIDPSSQDSVELTLWFSPDGTVPLPSLIQLIIATLNVAQIKGVEEDGFRHPFAKTYPA